MQLALRDKEEMLVEKALERIRRAQMLGKKNVKLTQPELDALERKRQKDQVTKDHASRRSSKSNLREDDRRRSSGQPGIMVKDRRPAKRKSKGYFSAYDGESSSSSRRATPPGVLVPGTGVVGFSPLSQYPPAQDRSSPSGSRSASSHNQLQPVSPISRGSKKRLSSGPEPSAPQPSRSPNMSRRLPDDADWIPRPRSSSSISGKSHPYDPYQYQTYSPPPSQVPPQYSHYGQGRRIVSNPQPTVQYPSIRGDAQSRSSEPSSMRREHSGQGTPEYSDSAGESISDDEDDGVQVNVVPYGQGYSISTRPESTARERPRRGGR